MSLSENPQLQIEIPENWETCTISGLRKTSAYSIISFWSRKNIKAYILTIVSSKNGLEVAIRNPAALDKTQDNPQAKKNFREMLNELKAFEPQIEIIFT